MSFGILGIISYIFIIAILIKQSIKTLKQQKEKKDYRTILSIIIGTLVLIIHSLMDFDMSYLIIEFIFFAFIAILNKNDLETNKKSNIIDYIVLIILTFIVILNILGFTSSLIKDETSNKKANTAIWISEYKYNRIMYMQNNKMQNDEQIDYIKQYIKHEPYKNQNEMYKILCDNIIQNFDTRTIEENIENIRNIIQIWENIKIEQKYEVKQIQSRAEMMLEFAEKILEKSKEINNENLKNQGIKILQIIQTEYKNNSSIILDYKKNHLSELISEYKFEIYNNLIEETINLEKENQK